MLTADTPGFTGPQILAATGAIAATIIGVGGAYKVLRGIVSAAFDGAVWESVKRKSPELEQHMRQLVFARELAAAGETRATADSAMRLCESNAKAIEALVSSQQTMAADIAELPRVSQALESVAESLGRVSDKLDQVGTKVDYVHGMVDQLRVSGVTIPPGARIPV